MKIGKVESGEKAGRRDAFHVPSVLAASKEALRPGDGVRFADAALTEVMVCVPGESRHGVVDPFARRIAPGELVWVMLEPDLVGDLTHQFQVKVSVSLPAPPAVISSPPPAMFTEEWDAADRARCEREGCS